MCHMIVDIINLHDKIKVKDGINGYINVNFIFTDWIFSVIIWQLSFFA